MSDQELSDECREDLQTLINLSRLVERTVFDQKWIQDEHILRILSMQASLFIDQLDFLSVVKQRFDHRSEDINEELLFEFAGDEHKLRERWDDKLAKDWVALSGKLLEIISDGVGKLPGLSWEMSGLVTSSATAFRRVIESTVELGRRCDQSGKH